MSYLNKLQAQDIEKKIKAQLLKLTKAYYKKELTDELVDELIPHIGAGVAELMEIVNSETSRPLSCGCTPGWCTCDSY